VSTCTDHEIRSLDASSPCWRASHEWSVQEYIAAHDERGRVLSTIWDCGPPHAGGRYRCDGSDAGALRLPLADWLASWLN
jgi:Ni,Fe-hydrogenase maturation factor